MSEETEVNPIPKPRKRPSIHKYSADAEDKFHKSIMAKIKNNSSVLNKNPSLRKSVSPNGSISKGKDLTDYRDPPSGPQDDLLPPLTDDDKNDRKSEENLGTTERKRDLFSREKENLSRIKPKPCVKISNDNTNIQNEIQHSYNWRKIAIIFIMCSAVIFSTCYYIFNSNNVNSRGNITLAIEEISRMNPGQLEETWQRLEIGLKNIKQYSRPSCFMATHYEQDNVARGIVTRVAQAASAFLDESNEDVGPLQLTLKDLQQLSDHGDLISQYGEKLIKHHVMVVEGIEEISGKITQGFRYICDEQNPKVANSSIIFIFNMKKCPDLNSEMYHKGKNQISMVENCLTEKWKNDLEINIIEPVLARIVETVVKIQQPYSSSHDKTSL